MPKWNHSTGGSKSKGLDVMGVTSCWCGGRSRRFELVWRVMGGWWDGYKPHIFLFFTFFSFLFFSFFETIYFLEQGRCGRCYLRDRFGFPQLFFGVYWVRKTSCKASKLKRVLKVSMSFKLEIWKFSREKTSFKKFYDSQKFESFNRKTSD